MFGSTDYSYLVRRKNSALGVFTKARDKLLGVIQQLSQEEAAAKERHQKEADNIAFLNKEILAVNKTVDSISRVLEGNG